MTFVGTLHCALENGADLYVNERQKIRYYRTWSTEERRPEEEECQIAMFNFARWLEISLRTRWWCLKYVIVYLGRDIPAFVMYCVYGESCSSLLIEATDYIFIFIFIFISIY